MVMSWFMYFLISIAGIFVIVNPLTSSFIFAFLTPSATEKQKRRIALRATKIGTTILLVLALLGGIIFTIFGVTIGAFKIAGGIVLIGMGLRMLRESEGEMVQVLDHGKVSEGIAVVPLAIPFMSGPGAIAAVMVLTTEAPSIFHIGIVFLAVLITTISCYFAMVYSRYIIEFVGETGRQVITKLFGLILTVIAIQFVINGIHDVIVDFDLFLSFLSLVKTL